jgi:hypothetical protein
MRQLADLYVSASGVIVCWAMGLTQHKTRRQRPRIVNLLLPAETRQAGAGACPGRGQQRAGRPNRGHPRGAEQALLSKLDAARASPRHASTASTWSGRSRRSKRPTEGLPPWALRRRDARRPHGERAGKRLTAHVATNSTAVTSRPARPRSSSVSRSQRGRSLGAPAVRHRRELDGIVHRAAAICRRPLRRS